MIVGHPLGFLVDLWTFVGFFDGYPKNCCVFWWFFGLSLGFLVVLQRFVEVFVDRWASIGFFGGPLHLR